MTDQPDHPPRRARPETPALRKRFYTAATVAPVTATDAKETADGAPARVAYRVLLDGRPLRTPAKAVLVLPTKGLAEAVAAEWAAQGDEIDPQTMPLTRLANSAIDGVRGREAEVRADIVKYSGSDLVCYRADSPSGLVERQAAAWDPVLAWSRGAMGAEFAVAEGIMPVAQSPAAQAAVARALESAGEFEVAALHVMTTLMGSALLALAHARGHLDATAAWSAAHVDEDWQIRQWGEDAEAKARRERRWSEMQAASRMLELVRAA